MPQAAAGSGLCGDGGVVGFGDRLHDGEPEPGPVGRGACLRSESLERLEQAGELTGRNQRAGVCDREGGASCDGGRGDVDLAARNVVTDGVIDEVRDEAFDQLRVAGCSGGLECRRAPESVMIVGSQGFGGGRGEVDGLPPQMPVLAPGQGEQRLEQPFLALAGGGNLLAHLSQGRRVCVGVSERGLRKRELEGDLAAQLVSGVGDEAPFRFGEVTGECRHRPAAHCARAARCMRPGSRSIVLRRSGPRRPW